MSEVADFLYNDKQSTIFLYSDLIFKEEKIKTLTSSENKGTPNLVFVFADQLRYQSCGYAGDIHAHTPNIDQLASESVNFSNAISGHPVCAPYRASLFTGKYSSSTGMVINELRLSPEHECLGHVLTCEDYQTAYIGKWHLWANRLGYHNRTIDGFVPPGPYRLGFDGFWAGYNFNHYYFNAPYFRDTPERRFYEKYEPDSQTDMAIEFIREATKRPEPFAVFLSWGPPHDPWNWDNVSPQFAEMFRDVEIPLSPNYSEEIDPYADNWGRLPENYSKNVQQFHQVYYAQTANLDWNLGRLMKAIDELGIAEDTIFVFTSDHGEMFGSHGRQAKNIFYEEAIRVPFLIRWHGHIPAGHVSDACLNAPDIMPTILSLMHFPVPDEVEGMDLSHLALSNTGPEPDAAYMQGMGTTAAWKDGHEWRALRDKQYTYAIYRRDGQELLFDRQADPYQMKNLADDRTYAATLAHYRDKLKQWMKQQNDSFEKCTWYRDHWTVDCNIVHTAKGGSHNLNALKKITTSYFPKRE